MKKDITPIQATPKLNSPAVDAVMAMISEAVIIVQDRQMTYVSPKAMEIFGVTDPAAMVGQSTRILYFSDEDFQEFGEKFYSIIKKQGFFSGMANLKRLSDGSPLQISWQSKIINNDKQTVVAVLKENKYSLLPPETVFKEAPVDFEEKVSEFGQILDSLNMAVVTINANGAIDYSNAKMKSIIDNHPTGKGMKCYETCEHIWSESGDDFCSWCHIHDVIHSGHPQKSIVKSAKGKQWLFSWAPIFGRNQAITKVVKTITDISSQMSESKYLETLLFDIFSAMPIGVVIYNGKGNIIFLNATMEKRWGLAYSQVAMTNLLDLEIYPDDQDLNEAFTKAKQGHQTLDLEVEVERHDGRAYWINTSIIPFNKDEDGWHGVLFEQDISTMAVEKKAVEEDLKDRETLLVEQDKLVAVGQLAAGIAHELNTPTTYVRGNMQTFGKYAEILKDLTSQLQDDKIIEKEHILTKMNNIIDNVKEISNSSFDGTSRIMKIISSMKSFVKTASTKNEQVDVFLTIQDAIMLIYNRIKHIGKITINGHPFSQQTAIDTVGDAVIVEGSATRITQLFIILLNNAIDAWTENQNKDHEIITLDFIINTKGKFVFVRLNDNAGGIPTELREKIFEPFFTTKAATTGTGLGLSIAKQIAGEHGGTLTCSDIEQGTCFLFQIPKITSQENDNEV